MRSEILKKIVEKMDYMFDADDKVIKKPVDNSHEDPYAETRKNLFAELERIAKAVKENGGAEYVDNGKFYSDFSLLYVAHNGCIGCAGFPGPHTINEIKVRSRDGKPIITGWAIDSVTRKGDLENLLNPAREDGLPGYMLYDINTGEYTIFNVTEMFKTYQDTLDDADGIAPVAATNCCNRIGGKYYGMSFDQMREAMAREKATA